MHVSRPAPNTTLVSSEHIVAFRRPETDISGVVEVGSNGNLGRSHFCCWLLYTVDMVLWVNTSNWETIFPDELTTSLDSICSFLYLPLR